MGLPAFNIPSERWDDVLFEELKMTYKCVNTHTRQRVSWEMARTARSLLSVQRGARVSATTLSVYIDPK